MAAQKKSMQDTTGKKAANTKAKKARVDASPKTDADQTKKKANSAETGQTVKHASGVALVSAECRGIAKIGGLADAVRDLAGALFALHCPVRVIMPWYAGLFGAKGLQESVCEFIANLTIRFAGKDESCALYRHCLPDGLPVYLIKSDRWFAGDYGSVYVDSAALGHGPFEDDATRFAFFSAAALECVRSLAEFTDVRVVHCHDWHSAVLLTLLCHDTRYAAVHARVKTLFTIHNLDYQGVRPWQGGTGSFESWFPGVYAQLMHKDLLASLSAPANGDCYNPMRAAIRCADMVSTVSPGYAREITLPDNPAAHFAGGRGLERDLAELAGRKRLPGILNGIDYAQHDPGKSPHPYSEDMPSWRQERLLGREEFVNTLPAWIDSLAKSHGAGFKNSSHLQAACKNFEPLLWKNRALFVAVTRVAQQKFGLLFSRMPDGRSLLEHFLDRPLALIVLGSGEFENALDALMERPNALFLNLFDAEAASRLYRVGDVFLMPSDFEPCGISQLISMRYACLPFVHDTGGLHDTVTHRETGFSYSGENLSAQQKSFLRLTDDILWFRENCIPEWTRMQERAMRARFSLPEQAAKYLELYAAL
ncbi:MAG: glycogen/starch synthase [Spirochaetota bacterium]|jgi:starch synthase|nr:glycogen/starch synthase [Spirochaetota bacterium]